MNKEQILQRLAEIREMMNDEEKRGDNKFSDLEKEVIQLKSDLEEIESRERLGGLDFGAKEGKTLQQQAHQSEDPELIKPTSEQREAFQHYLETREIEGDSLVKDDGFVVIPEEIIQDILVLKEKEFNLDQYVTVKSVANGSGKFPVVRQSQVAALPEVDELDENPALAVKPFYMLGYEIKTYRGYFRVSKEAIEDAAVNVLAELLTWMARSIAATRNAAIVKAIKEGTPGKDGETVTFEKKETFGIDGIKDVINLNLTPNYEHNVAIVSNTAFATLDKMKDKNGNYLLQADIKEPTTKRLLGATVIPLPDEMLGEDGANTIIVGNLKDGVVLFERSRYQAGWTNYMHFGESLMVAVRQDVRILDEKAVIVIDFQDEQEEVTP